VALGVTSSGAERSLSDHFAKSCRPLIYKREEEEEEDDDNDDSNEGSVLVTVDRTSAPNTNRPLEAVMVIAGLAVQN
jgi:hypothetical protein